MAEKGSDPSGNAGSSMDYLNWMPKLTFPVTALHNGVAARDLSLEERAAVSDLANFLQQYHGAPAALSPSAGQLSVRDASLEKRSKAGDDAGDFFKSLAGGLVGGFMKREAEASPEAEYAHVDAGQDLQARDLSLEERSQAGEDAKAFFANLGLGLLGGLGKREAEALLDAHYAQLPEGQDLQARDLSLEERGLGPLTLFSAIPGLVDIVKQNVAPLVNKGKNPQVQQMQAYPPQAGAAGQVAGAVPALPGAAQRPPPLTKRNDAAKMAGGIIGKLFGLPLQMFTGGLGSTASGQATQALPQAPPPPPPQALTPPPPPPPATGKPSRRSRVRRSDQDSSSLSLKRAAAALGVLGGLNTVPFNGFSIPAKSQNGEIGAPNQPASGAVQGNSISGGILGKRADDAADSGHVLERCANGCPDEGHTSITTSVPVASTAMFARDDAAVTPGPAPIADSLLHERLLQIPAEGLSTLQTSVKGKTDSKKPEPPKTKPHTSKPCTGTSTVPGASRTHDATGHRNSNHGAEVTVTRTIPAKPHLPKTHGTSKTHVPSAKIHGGTAKTHGATKPHSTTEHHGTSKPHPTSKPHGTSKPHETSKPHGTSRPHGATARPDSHPATETEVITKTVLVTGRPTPHRSSKIAKPTSANFGPIGPRPFPLTAPKDPNRGPGVKGPVEERSDSENHEENIEQRDNSESHEGAIEQRDDSEGKVEQRDNANEPVEQ